MGSQVCVSGAQVSLTPLIPAIQLAVPVSTIPGNAQSKWSVTGKNVLVPRDIEDWAKQYVSNYTGLPTFNTPMAGLVTGDSVQISGLSNESNPAGVQAVLQTTEITLTVKVDLGDANTVPPPAPPLDQTPQFDVKVVFTNPGQTKLTST